MSHFLTVTRPFLAARCNGVLRCLLAMLIMLCCCCDVFSPLALSELIKFSKSEAATECRL